MLTSKNCFNYLLLARDILPRSPERTRLSYFVTYTQSNHRLSKTPLDINEFVWRSRIQSPNGNVRNKT